MPLECIERDILSLNRWSFGTIVRILYIYLQFCMNPMFVHLSVMYRLRNEKIEYILLNHYPIQRLFEGKLRIIRCFTHRYKFQD